MINRGQCLARIVLLPLLGSSLLLAGCWDRNEINDLAIVLATGVDVADDEVELTAQIFVPRNGSSAEGGSSSGGSASGATLIRTAKGATIAEAQNRLQRQVSREMFWGHCEVIVISKQAGQQGLREYIDFFLRYPQFREHAYVFSSEEKAKEMLALLDPLERNSAESLREMAILGLGARVTVLELAKRIKGPSETVILSRLLVSPSTHTEQSALATSPTVNGLSLYNRGYYVKTVTEPMSIGVLMLVNELNNIVLQVKAEELSGSFSVRSRKIDAKLKPSISQGKWSMKIIIDAKGDLVLNTTNASLAEPQVMATLEQAWEAKLKLLAKQALWLAQDELHADLFQFALEFRKHFPKQWKAQSSQWDNIYSNMEVEIEVHTQITGTGKSTTPQGRPGRENK